MPLANSQFSSCSHVLVTEYFVDSINRCKNRRMFNAKLVDSKKMYDFQNSKEIDFSHEVKKGGRDRSMGVSFGLDDSSDGTCGLDEEGSGDFVSGEFDRSDVWDRFWKLTPGVA